MISFTSLFSKKQSAHPLARDEHVTTVLAELPVGDPAQVLKDVTHWLILLASDDVVKNRPAKLFRIDQAAQIAERKLRQQYTDASRLHKAIEEQAWNTAFEFLEASINTHFRCILEYRTEGRSRGDPRLAAMAVRAIRRLDLQAHWIQLRYQPLPQSMWEKIYALIKIAEDEDVLRTPVSLNPASGANTTFVQEMLKLLMMATAEPQRLTKGQIALARQLTNGLADQFVWETVAGGSSGFRIDFSTRTSPTRMTQTSEQHFMARRFGPGGAVHKLVTGLKQVEQGRIPSMFVLSDPPSYRRADLLEVLAHLSQRWCNVSPLVEHQHFDKRNFERKAFFLRMSVTHGFRAIHAALTGEDTHKKSPVSKQEFTIVYDEQLDMHIHGFITDKTREQRARLESTPSEAAATTDAETWVAYDVSETGYGINVRTTPEDWVAPNVIVGVQGDGTEYQVGVIRRVASESVENTDVGIHIISRKPRAVMLRPVDSQLSVWETAADTQTYHHTPAILLPRDAPVQQDESLLLAADSYKLHKIYVMTTDAGQRYVKLLDRIAAHPGVDQVAFANIDPKGKGKL